MVKDGSRPEDAEDVAGDTVTYDFTVTTDGNVEQHKEAYTVTMENERRIMKGFHSLIESAEQRSDAGLLERRSWNTLICY